MMILEACGFHPTTDIAHLIDRHLLSIGYCKRLMMHNLIRDMGREIVRREHSNPGERSRLWHPEDCFSVLRDRTGSCSVEAFVYDMHSEDNSAGSFSSSSDMDFKTMAFARMKRIKFLQLNFVKLAGGYKNFPKGLRWLCWHGFHLNCMPNDFPLYSLSGLDLQYSSLKHVWKGTKFLPSLKTLNLSHSKWLEGTPKFSQVPNLEMLILKGCVRLVEVCESIEFAKRLAVLDLENCKRLKKLPRKLGIKLERLIISGCSSLCEFPTGNLDSLKVFQADGVDPNAIFFLQQQVSLPRFLLKLSLVGSISTKFN